MPFVQGRVSIKLLPFYTSLENILVKGKAINKHGPVDERKSRYKTRIIAKFQRTVLVDSSHSREEKTLSYSRINMVSTVIL